MFNAQGTEDSRSRWETKGQVITDNAHLMLTENKPRSLKPPPRVGLRSWRRLRR